MHHRKLVVTTAVVAAAIWTWTAVAPAPALAQAVQPLEEKCNSKVAKSASKQAKTYGKVTAKCRDDQIAAATGPYTACPTDLTKISAASTKVVESAVGNCGSFCSVHSTLACMAPTLCPPQVNAGSENCSAPEGQPPDGNSNFDMRNINFPGPLCGTITANTDLGNCVAGVENGIAQKLIDVAYGTIDGTSGISPGAASCVKSLSKQVQKIASTIFKGVIKCRGGIQKGKITGNPLTCTTDDTKLAEKIAGGNQKLADTAAASCTDAQILELDLCLAGVGGTLTVADAVACLTEAANEIGDTTLPSPQRLYSVTSLVETAYPSLFPACGDGVVNQIPNPFQLLGEECDLDDDDDCTGACVPPDDVFGCTCPGSPRQRFFADGFVTDLDSGWSGTSHNSGVTDDAGYIYELLDCDCAAFDGSDIATCISSTDPLCNVRSRFQLPSCSWEPFNRNGTCTVGICNGTGSLLAPATCTTNADCGRRCDQNNTVTGPNGTDTDADCYICDDFSINASENCRPDGLGVPANECESQCFNGAVPTGPCDDQDDCAAGQVCRGQCDTTQGCIIVPNGHPLPISSGGTAVCVDNLFRADITGTANIVTGEHALFVQQYSKVHLGTSNTTPCPVCGGFCDLNDSPANLAGKVCEGRCSVTTGDSCRFDDDCPSGETCTTDAPECGGGTCLLSLVCGGGEDESGLNEGFPCRIGAFTRDFGTTSTDCPPAAGKNISGTGLSINFLPQTSETRSLPPVLACANAAFANYDCPCPGAGGLPPQPNKCAAACNTGTNLGQGCANGAGAIQGLFTSCSNGVLACDEDADCVFPGTCTDNPTHCDPVDTPAALARVTCASNGDCGGGTCVDACPGGECVALCLQADDPQFPPGFGGDSADDPEEGLCAAGPPFYHCGGEGNTFIICERDAAEGACSAVCAASCGPGGVPSGGSAGACDEHSDCPSGETCCGDCELSRLCDAGINGIIGDADDQPGAGICFGDARNCFVNDAAAEGGDMLNGNGDPTNVRSAAAYCIPATSNAAINSTAGLGGPGRRREQGVNVPSFTTLP